MGEIYKVTDEDRSGKTDFDINSINNLIIQNEKLVFTNVSFDKLSGVINRPINIDLFDYGIKINGRLVPNSLDVKIIEFNKGVDFKYVKFLGKSIFRDTVIKGTLNLRNTIFDDEANFLDVTSVKREKSSENKKEFIGVHTHPLGHPHA